MANLGAPYQKKDSTAAIGPLGLLGFGLTTFLLNLGNAGVFDMAPPVLAMGICYGGLAQLIAHNFAEHENTLKAAGVI